MTKVIANYILLEIICVSKLSQVLGKFYFIFVVNYQHLCCPTNTLQLLNILFPTKSALFVINVELDKGISNHWDQKKKKKKIFSTNVFSPTHPNLMTCIILSSVNQNYQMSTISTSLASEGVNKQFLGKERRQQKMEATQLSLANRGRGRIDHYFINVVLSVIPAYLGLKKKTKQK